MSNAGRFAAVPLTDAGTTPGDWLRADPPPPLDLSDCPGLLIAAPHPDDETFGLGALAAQLASAGVEVRVLSVSDGGGAVPGASAAGRATLEAERRIEVSRAATVLGVSPPIRLGLPDGRLTEFEDALADAIANLLAPGQWCAATWRGDGHPDHEAVGRAAATAARRTGAVLLEYPVWMWHWAAPGDPAVPWRRAAAVPSPEWAVERKHQAAQCFRSQFDPDSPVLPPHVLARLLAVGELVFR